MKFSKKFVSEDTSFNTYERNVPSPIFRKSFVLEKEADFAQILICGLGFYDLWVNGTKITKGYLAPYVSNSDHITYFDPYDIKPYLVKGENVIGVMLGDGHLVGKTCVWNFKDNIMNAAPMLALSAEIKAGDDTISFEADEFVCKKGPVLFNDLRSGVFYDARLEEQGWNCPGFVEKDWHQPIKANRPRGKAKICEAEPVRVYKEIKPVSIVRGEISPYTCSGQVTAFADSITAFEAAPAYTGGYIFDFGENNSGIYRLRIKGTAGQKIDIQCAEQLRNGKIDYSNISFYPDGFSQRDIYYLKGDGEEVFEPMFTFHGYRYIYVSSITEEQAAEDLLTYLVMSSDLEERGTFECSDPLTNQIYQMGRRSDRSNFFYFPLDCPHREKNGWTGDASISAEHMIMTIGAEKSWREWLCNIREAQTTEGQLPGIVPTGDWGYTWGNGPAWDSVIFNLPYFAYKYRGETEIIKENAGAMLRYLEYISKRRDERGLVAVGLGDWVPVDREAGDYEADLGFTDSVMVLDMCRKGAEMFGVLGLNLHQIFAQQLGQEMLAAIRKEYVDNTTYIVKNKCQTSQAMAIFYDVFTAEEKAKGFEVLLDIIREDHNSFTSGFQGMRVVFHVLSEFGQSELAYHMITKAEYPSYGYWAAKGETTLMEQFRQYNDDGFYRWSKNHHFLGDIVNWFMSRVGGLQVVSPDFVKVKPYYIEKLDWCRTTHKLPGGEIEIYWERRDGDVELKVNCTGNVKYEIG